MARTTPLPETQPAPPPAPAPEPQAPPADEFAGQGGSYVIEHGSRRLAERTRGADDAAPFTVTEA